VFARQRLQATLEATGTMLARLFGTGSNALQAPTCTRGTYVDGYCQGPLPIGTNLGGGQLYTLGLGWTPMDIP